jgi:ankyrin repeat protein
MIQPNGMRLHQLIDADSTAEAEVLLCGDSTLVHHRAEGGDSVLHTAKSFAMIQLLLRHGANPNATNDSGQTPLHEAAIQGELAKVKALLEGGADANLLSHAGNSPLYEACSSKNPGCEEVAKLLLEHGAVADLNCNVSLGNETDLKQQLHDDPNAVAHARHPSALVWDAVVAGSPSVLRLLLEYGATPNAFRGLGPPPLILAIQMASTGKPHYLDIIQLLLEHGADPNVDSPPCGKAVEWAKSSHADAIVSLLRKSGARD